MLISIFLPRYVLAGESSVLGCEGQMFTFFLYVEVAWLAELIFDTKDIRIPENALSAEWDSNPHSQCCVLLSRLGKTSRPGLWSWPRGFP